MDDSGNGVYEVVSAGLTLGDGSGAIFDADGSSVMIHSEPNNEEGGAGARIACGVFVADEAPATLPVSGAAQSSTMLWLVALGAVLLMAGLTLGYELA